MPTTLDRAVVRRPEPVSQNAPALAVISMLAVAVVLLAIWGLSSSDGVQSSFTSDSVLGIALPP